jgi:hypothetical protein
MKFRKGFVSNSSSSSFVIAIPKDTVIDFGAVMTIMFPGPDDIGKVFGHYSDTNLGTAEAAEIVTRDLRDKDAFVNFDETHSEDGEQSETNFEQAIGGYFYSDGVPEFFREVIAAKPDWSDHFDKIDYKDREAWWAANESYNKANGLWVAQMREVVAKHWGDKDLYVIEYGDDYTIGSIMEHGGVFDSMIERGIAMKISHH